MHFAMFQSYRSYTPEYLSFHITGAAKRILSQERFSVQDNDTKKHIQKTEPATIA